MHGLAADSPDRRRTLEVAIPALLLLIAGLTIVFVGLDDLASGSAIIRESGKPTVVATAVGRLASDFCWHVCSLIAAGAVFIAIAAALLFVLRFGAPAAREKLLAFNERSRYGNNKPPAAAPRRWRPHLRVAITYWLLRD